MAKNLIEDGRVIQYLNGTGADIASGAAVLVGALMGVAQVDILDGESGSVALEGVWELPKAAGAVGQGAQLYWDADGTPVGGVAGAGALTTVDEGNIPAGKAFVAVSADVPLVSIKINV